MKGRVKAEHVVASITRVTQKKLFITFTTTTGGALYLVNRDGLRGERERERVRQTAGV